MEELRVVSSGWSWEENKLFEIALTVVDEQNPNRWEVIAAMIGGRSAEDVAKHYGLLLEDLQSIESGEMDHRIEAQHTLPAECNTSMSWTDRDQKLLIGLEIK